MYVQYNFLVIKKSKHMTSTKRNVQIRVGCHPVIRSIIADYDCNLFLMRANTCHMLQCLLPNLEQKFWWYSFLQLLSHLPVYHTYWVLVFCSWFSLKKKNTQKNGSHSANNENLVRNMNNLKWHFSLIEKVSSSPRKRLILRKMMTVSIINHYSMYKVFLSSLGS